MSLSKLSGVASSGDGFIARTLNTPMSRREFLQMSGTLVLTMFGVHSFLSVIAKHTNNSSAVSLLAPQTNGFGTRKFGQ